ncbi:MAG: hypothetical protein Ct9H90mP20_0460 [Candidatus Neomarinimicrobiota bacterium]|nr:MAG: hypothetical protein Ct9H90mP20_0460 [Candidatus Neomarinimicrobiota bacterium]
MNYGVYASKWKSQIILADGIGRVDAGNLILSKWKTRRCKEASASTQRRPGWAYPAFLPTRNVITAKVDMPGTPFFASMRT